jgi:gamma-glutamylcyclotransferase (GGCT)/AIG2-like uncharacterized protein YtfP
MEKLFVYGTLQDPDIQKSLVGRIIFGTPARLANFEKTTINLGGRIYPIVRPAENKAVNGMVLEVTSEELARFDRYETNAYRRITAKLDSGQTVWVYSE